MRQRFNEYMSSLQDQIKAALRPAEKVLESLRNSTALECKVTKHIEVRFRTVKHLRLADQPVSPVLCANYSFQNPVISSSSSLIILYLFYRYSPYSRHGKRNIIFIIS